MLLSTKASIGVSSKFMIPAIPLKVSSVYDAIERTERTVHLFYETFVEGKHVHSEVIRMWFRAR